jgi:hypothetical protein
MPTFQISDPSSVVPLTLSGEGAKLRAMGKVVFAVENTSAISRSGAVSILPDKPDDPEVYSLAAGTSPSAPGVVSLDFAARETQNVTVTISAPPGAEARKGAFRLLVVQELNTDYDVAESRPVTFDIPKAAPAPPPPAAKPFPWLALAIAAAAVVVVVSVAIWLIPGPKMVHVDLTGHNVNDVVPTIEALNGQVSAVYDYPTIKDNMQCGTTVKTQAPSAQNNLYPVGTILHLTLLEGTRSDPQCHLFDPNTSKSAHVSVNQILRGGGR